MVLRELPSRTHECVRLSEIQRMGGVDVLVVLGKNIGVGSTKYDIRNNPRNLSMESKMAVRGALQLVENGLVNRALLFSGGYTAGSDISSEAQAMYDYYIDRVSGKSPHVILEENSIDTSSNAKYVRSTLEQMMERGDLGLRYDSRIGLVTAGFHLDRACRYFENYGIGLSWRGASEDLLALEGKRYGAFKGRYLSTNKVRAEELKEERRMFIQRFDPKGRIPQTLHRFGWRG